MRPDSIEQAMASKATTPAKPRPQDTGMTSARKMPATQGTCQASQLVIAAPQKKASCPGAGFCSGKRCWKTTKITSPLHHRLLQRRFKGNWPK
jgi:hypothetical protein